MLHETSTDID